MTFFRYLHWVHRARSKEAVVWVTQAMPPVTEQGRHRQTKQMCGSSYSQDDGITSVTGWQ